ncbi:MAG: VTC domain-containing protein [Thermoflexales bacterium]|nr:VTC domain-containing protein [Thermoflexales bacterium]
MQDFQARYEIKLVCPSDWLPQVESAVRLHPEGFRTAFPPRRVNNIYLDSWDAGSVTSNLSGVGERAKLRWRWYGPALSASAGQLELKRKRGLVGWKEVCVVAEALDLARPWPHVLDVLRQQADERFQVWLSQVSSPAIVNHYERSYYVSWDGQLRLTLDTRQIVYDQRFSRYPNLRYRAPLMDTLIVELKAGARLANRLSAALGALPFRPERNSKYINGFMATSDFLRG